MSPFCEQTIVFLIIKVIGIIGAHLHNNCSSINAVFVRTRTVNKVFWPMANKFDGWISCCLTAVILSFPPWSFHLLSMVNTDPVERLPSTE